MVAKKKTLGWRVKTSDGLYVWREYSFSQERNVMYSHTNKPVPTSLRAAVELMVAWMDCGYVPTLVRVTSATRKLRPKKGPVDPNNPYFDICG
jgi:hypothetical protein